MSMTIGSSLWFLYIFGGLGLLSAVTLSIKSNLSTEWMVNDAVFLARNSMKP